MAKSAVSGKILQDVYYLHESRKTSIICRILARYLIFCESNALYLIFARTTKDIFFERITQDVYYLARCLLSARSLPDIWFLLEVCQASNFCKNLARILLFAKKFGKISIIQKNIARYLFNMRTLEYNYCLQEPFNNFNKGRNLSRNPLLPTTLHFISFLQGSCRISIFSKNPAGNLSFARILQDFFLQNSCKLSFFCEKLAGNFLFATILQDICYLQESGKISIICMNPASYLLLARTSQDIYYLQESCKIFVFCRNRAAIFYLHYSCKISFICNSLPNLPLYAGILRDIFFFPRIAQGI